MFILRNDKHAVMSMYLTILLFIKIFDFVVNAADNKQRDKNMTCIKVCIDP